MNAKTRMNVMLAVVTALSTFPAWADDPVQQGTVVSGEITPKLYYFDYFKDSGANKTQFLERYNYQEGFDDDRRSGFYADADLNLTIASPERNVFTLERLGFRAPHHPGTL